MHISPKILAMLNDANIIYYYDWIELSDRSPNGIPEDLREDVDDDEDNA